MGIMEEYNGKVYDNRHGGPFDRGAADSYYGRFYDPHFYSGATYQSDRINKKDMSEDELEAYHAGFDWNEQSGDKKEW